MERLLLPHPPIRQGPGLQVLLVVRMVQADPGAKPQGQALRGALALALQVQWW